MLAAVWKRISVRVEAEVSWKTTRGRVSQRAAKQTLGFSQKQQKKKKK